MRETATTVDTVSSVWVSTYDLDYDQRQLSRFERWLSDVANDLGLKLDKDRDGWGLVSFNVRDLDVITAAERALDAAAPVYGKFVCGLNEHGEVVVAGLRWGDSRGDVVVESPKLMRDLAERFLLDVRHQMAEQQRGRGQRQAIVHKRSTELGGSERVVEQLHHSQGRRSWSRATEVLLSRLEVLLDERELLQRKLTTALGDVEVATAKLDQLQAAYDALVAEQYRVKEWRSPVVLVQLVLALTTWLAPVSAAVMDDDDLTEAVRQTVQAAERVRVDCAQDVDVDVRVDVVDDAQLTD